MRGIDFFSAIYVINLPERKDRLRHISSELSRVCMPIASPKVRIVAGIRPKVKEPFHKLGSKGCFLTTLNILRSAVRDGHHRILILQDDALFSSAFLEHERKIFASLELSAWDIAQFGYHPLPGNSASVRFCDECPSDPGTLVPYAGEVIGAHCFALNGSSIAKFARFLEEMLTRPLGDRRGGPMPIDGAMNVYSWQPNVIRLVAAPSLVGQWASASDVTPRLFDRLPVTKTLAMFGRLARSSLKDGLSVLGAPEVNPKRVR